MTVEEWARRQMAKPLRYTYYTVSGATEFQEELMRRMEAAFGTSYEDMAKDYWQDRRNWHSPGLHDHKMFRVGDIVTRDGSDLQRIDAINDARDLIDVTCIRAPRSGWCVVGETESNIARRYSYPPDLTIEGTRA